MPWTMWIHETEVDNRVDERQIIVPSVPDNHLSFRFGGTQDGLIIDASINHRPLLHVRFVFLAFFDGTVLPIQVIKRRKALDALCCKVSVRHGVAQHDGMQAMRAPESHHASGDSTFATPRYAPHRPRSPAPGWRASWRVGPGA
jgi:hypothetical protein